MRDQREHVNGLDRAVAAQECDDLEQMRIEHVLPFDEARSRILREHAAALALRFRLADRRERVGTAAIRAEAVVGRDLRPVKR